MRHDRHSEHDPRPKGLVVRLRELIDSLDSRVPQLEREGEMWIADEAAVFLSLVDLPPRSHCLGSAGWHVSKSEQRSKFFRVTFDLLRLGVRRGTEYYQQMSLPAAHKERVNVT